MSEMVERAALAAWIAYSVHPDDMDSEDDDVFNRAAAVRQWNEEPTSCTHVGADGFRLCARAAIEAMLEPTGLETGANDECETMMRAGVDAFFNWDAGDDNPVYIVSSIYRAMIAAALTPTPPSP